jgi:hypothetical protein
MKRSIIWIAVLFAGLALTGRAQERQSGEVSYKSIIPEDKQKLLNNIDMFANTQLNFRNDFNNGDYLGSKFRIEQLRLEIKGYIHPKIYFRFRHRYTSSFEPQTIDKIIKGVDFAYLTFTLSDVFKLTVGKTYADWGGIEFDLNPIDIYEYSDIIEMADNFLTGVELHIKAGENNSFGVQFINSRTGTFEELYDTVPNFTASKVPFGAVLNWRGSLFGGRVTTIWSYSLFTEAKGVGKNYIALGQQFHSDKIDVAYDYKISFEGLDRTGIISNEIPDNLYNYAVEKTLYRSHWSRITWKFNPKWHLSLDAFVDFADWRDDLDPLKTENRFRTVYSYVPTIEYFPWEDFNLKFFLGYVGRHYKYSDYAQNRIGLHDYNTSRVIIGLISPLKFL